MTCTTCRTEVNVHYFYSEQARIFFEGPCSSCGESVRFSLSTLLAAIVMPPSKGNGGMN